MLLPSAWVDSLFERLSVRYGEAFLRQYAGLDMAKVKADWAQCLGLFADRPDAIQHGLASLDQWPPHALRFKELCLPALREERQGRPLLEAPKARPEVVDEALGKARAGLGLRIGMRDWAHRLREREERGDKLTPLQREAWRTALGQEEDFEPA